MSNFVVVSRTLLLSISLVAASTIITACGGSTVKSDHRSAGADKTSVSADTNKNNGTGLALALPSEMPAGVDTVNIIISPVSANANSISKKTLLLTDDHSSDKDEEDGHKNDIFGMFRNKKAERVCNGGNTAQPSSTAGSPGVPVAPAPATPTAPTHPSTPVLGSTGVGPGLPGLMLPPARFGATGDLIINPINILPGGLDAWGAPLPCSCSQPAGAATDGNGGGPLSGLFSSGDSNLFSGPVTIYSLPATEKQFKLDGIEAGKYEIVIELVNSKTGRVVETGATQVVIEAGKVASANIKLTAIPDTTGSVVVTVERAPTPVAATATK